MNLRDTQQLFMNYLLSGDSSQELSPTEEAAKIASLIANQPGISVEKRLGIYANAYRARLRETIDTDHEMLGLYLGDEMFDLVVEEYVKKHPSGYYSLRDFCEHLPTFLKEDEHFRDHLILSDLAGFERSLLNAFDAAESSRAEFSDVQAVEPQLWPIIRFRFHPSVQIFRCHSNAVESWQALKAGDTPPPADYSAERFWLLWRGVNRVSEFVSLAPYEQALIHGFMQGKTFAHQCEAMLEWFDTERAPQRVLESLQNWFACGVVHRVVVY